MKKYIGLAVSCLCLFILCCFALDGEFLVAGLMGTACVHISAGGILSTLTS
jgi:hypothetical protein